MSLVSGATAAAFGVFIFAQDPQHRVNRAFLWLCMTLAYWGFCEFQLRSVADDATAQLWGRAFALWPLTVSAFLHFAVTFAAQQRDRKLPRFGLVHGPAILLSALGLFSDVLQGPPVPLAWGYSYGLPSDMTVRYLAIAWAVGVALYSLVLVLRRRGAAANRAARLQASFIALGLSLPVLAGGVTEAALHVVRLRVPELTTVAFALGCLSIGFGVWRYGLFRLSGAHVAGSVVRALPDAILAVNLRGQIASANNMACALLGMTEHEIIGTDLDELVTDGAPRLLAKLRSVPRCEGDVEFTTRNGDRVPVTYVSAQLIAGTGVLRGHTLVLRDLRDKRRAEEQSRLHARFADAVVSTLPGVFYLVRTDGTFARWNRRFETVTGYSEAEISRMNAADMFEGDEKGVVSDRIAAVFEVGQSSVEAELRLKDGTRIPYFFTGSRVEYEGAPHLVGVGVDVSEQRRLEQELMQAQKMQAVGTLAGGIAHDFNNLLTVILGSAELMALPLSEELDEKARAEVQADLGEIVTAGQRAARLIQQLLQFSRKQQMRREVVVLSEVVAPLTSMLHRLLGEDLRLEVSAAPNLWPVFVDVSSVEQVIVNLVINARDATESGGTIEIRMANSQVAPDDGQQARGALAGAYVCLSVIDEGRGIEPEQLTHIFEPFYTTKGVGEGTGLGLSVVYGVVQQLNGWIDVRTTPGHGARFDVYLPRCTTLEEGDGAGRLSPSVAPRRGVNAARILLVEDEPSVRRFALVGLRRMGYEVEEASGLHQALARFSGGSFDLLFSDVVLPDGNGLDLARLVRELKPDLPIVLASGYTGEKSRVEEILAEGFHFLQKPYRLAELQRAIASGLDPDSSKPQNGETIGGERP
jgi:PAS domain S-box-containing protein